MAEPPRKSPQTSDTPPGATREAWDRPVEPGGGPAGSGAGPRHAADDADSEAETYGATDDTRTPASPPAEDEDPLERGPPYSGRSGGAVGGTPAQKRSAIAVPRRPTDTPAPAPPRPTESARTPNAMTLRLTGFDAIEFAEKTNRSLNKHPDPITGPCVGLNLAEARAIAADDPDLIWLDVSVKEYYEGPPTSYEPDR